MEFHEVSNIFPMMSEDEYKNLVEDIRINGQRERIWIYQEKIIDGRNRYKACRELGIEPKMHEWDGSGSLVAFLVSLNLHRRHLTPSQVAVVGLDALPFYEAEAEERRRILGRQAALVQHYGADRVTEKIPEPTGEARVQIAKLIGVNPHYISDAKKIKETSSELLDAVKRGTINIAEAKEIAKLPEEKRAVIIERVANSERRDEIRKETKKVFEAVKIEERRETMQAQGLPDGKYKVIYCDPPWQYSNSGFAMSAEKQYPTMSLDELKALEIEELADENCIMFMWATNPLLADAMELMDYWGFEYKTNMVWVKDQHTAGFYVFGKHELLLIGVKGSMLPIGEKPISVITGDNNVHSKKPEIVYDLIEGMFPGLKYVELFARNARPNWTVWGNEVCETKNHTQVI